MNYLKKVGKYILLLLLIMVGFNLYFLLLMREKNPQFLWYLDLLLGCGVLLFFIIDGSLFYKKEKKKKGLLSLEQLIYGQFAAYDNMEIAEHDSKLLQKQLQKAFSESCDLQDYVAKWVHELKIPLATELLLCEKITDVSLRGSVREQLERMGALIHSLLLGCKLQGPLMDMQVKRTALADCVKTSIRNNQFFLIQKKFELCVEIKEEQVYTDPAWLVYCLDQLIGNAIKYTRWSSKTGQGTGAAVEWDVEQKDQDTPRLHIWVEEQDRACILYVEDNGEGIRSEDLLRIFEKGYTGSNYHNGQYKSTGMGLYMVDKICKRLEHELTAESMEGVYTRFGIRIPI